eukprot:19780-Pelagococcus_subviridis.AAC.1
MARLERAVVGLVDARRVAIRRDSRGSRHRSRKSSPGAVTGWGAIADRRPARATRGRAPSRRDAALAAVARSAPAPRSRRGVRAPLSNAGVATIQKNV